MLNRLLVPNRKQMLTAGANGVVTTAVDIGVLVVLVELIGAAVPVAAFCAALVGAVVNFVLNKHVAFRDRTPITAEQLLRFAAVAGATALLMALAMKLFAVEFHVPYLFAKVISGVGVFVVWTYPAQRRLVFARLAHA